MIFLDSDALIDLLRGYPQIAKVMAEHKSERFGIPVPILNEIYYGFYFPHFSKKYKNDTNFLNRVTREEQALHQLLNDIEIFDVNIKSIQKAAKISAELDAAGNHIGPFDSLIAGVILSHGYNRILTKNNRHFDLIADMAVFSY